MDIALGLLLLAAMLGGYLAIRITRGSNAPAGWVVGPIHGILGAIGLVALIVFHKSHHRLAAMGLGGFAIGAEVLLGAALLAGLLMGLLASWRGYRPVGLAVGAHATLAISGIVLVLAIVALGRV